MIKILKRLTAFALLAAVAFQGVACSSSDTSAPADTTSTGESASEATPEAGTTLSVAIWDTNQEPGIKEIMADFTAETGIEVNIQVTPWQQYWTMLEAGATGGTLPDVFWMHTNEFSRYAEYEMLLDITDRVAASENLDMTKFPEDIVNIYTYENGSLYAVPKDIDTIALWYNKTMFDEAGVPYPDDSWTWDDFEAAAAALTKDDGSQYGYAMQTTEGQQTFYNTVYSMGGSVVNADKTASGYDMPESIEAIEFMSSLTLNGYTPPYETLAENTADALFQSGTVAMVTMGSWMIPAMANNEFVVENCDIAVLPKDADTGRRVSIYNGLGWAAAANTEMPEEAWALIEYMGTEAAQQKQSDLGIVMSAYEGTATNFVNSNPNFNIQAYLDMMSDMVIFPHTKSTVAWTNAIDPVYVEIWSGQTSAADGCVEMAEIMNGHISQE